MAIALAPQQERYFPNLQNKAHQDLVHEAFLLRSSIYDIRDYIPDVVDMTLTANIKFDRSLVVGKPVILIARQDTVGGWTITWASKFHGTNLIAAVTTANTFSVYEFYATKVDYALLTNWISGGNL